MTDETRDPAASLGSAHTPGPWVIPVANIFRVFSLKDNNPHRVIVGCTAESKAWFGGRDIGWKDTDSGHEAAANARLIAAAPELLAAARALVEWHDRQGSAGVLDIVVAEARSAIAKALGQ